MSQETPQRDPIETQDQAMAEARRRFGDRAVVGHGRPVASWAHQEVFYVGWKEVDVWAWLGLGRTWDEAFASVKKVKTHYRDKLLFYK